jgi:Domain of unknown function (DUF4386)
MTHRWLSRLAAASGLLYVVLGTLSTGGGGDPASPTLASSGESIVRYTANHKPGAGLLLLYLVAVLMLLVFAIVLYGRLRNAEPAPGAVAIGVLVGAVIAITVELASFPASMVLSGRGGETDPTTAYALFAWNDYAFVFSLFGQSFMLGAVAVGGLLYGGIPRWLAASGGVVCVGLLVNAATGLSSDNPFFLGELLFLLWVAVASITLMIRTGVRSSMPVRAEVAAAST